MLQVKALSYKLVIRMSTTIHFNNTLNVFLVRYILLFVFRLFLFLNYLIFHQDRIEPRIQHASKSEVVLRRNPPGGGGVL